MNAGIFSKTRMMRILLGGILICFGVLMVIGLQGRDFISLMLWFIPVPAILLFSTKPKSIEAPLFSKVDVPIILVIFFGYSLLQWAFNNINLPTEVIRYFLFVLAPLCILKFFYGWKRPWKELFSWFKESQKQ